ncbi:MAG TPA: NADH-quinone oxidoreductase subunit J [Ktedonobacterales bacterium]|jgi:NADH-quinone oxidoreductase subunit J
MIGTTIAFYVLAAATLLSGAGVVLFRDAVYSMLSLICNLLCLALFFLLLGGLFIATIQVLIYAGAVMVLFLFVVTMLAPDAQAAGTPAPGRQIWQWGAGTGLAVILAGSLIVALTSGAVARDARAAGGDPGNGLAEHVASLGGNVEAFGYALFHGFSFPFEVTSALLVVAVLGAVVLGRRASRS